MTNLLVKLFIKDTENTKNDVTIRQKYGVLAGIVGIICNIVLVIIKIITGIITSSVSIIADGLNNLSDAGSSIITLVGYKLSLAPSDDEHPFGHGRIEYISGFVVSMIIIFVGFEMAQTSIGRIVSPEKVEFNYISIIILLVSILIKLWMYFFNTKISKKISSTTLKATAFDSLTDAIATFAVVLGVIIQIIFNVNIDGYIGLLVTLFILYAGLSTAKDTMSLLLGEAPDKDFVDSIKNKVMSYDNVVGIHDMIVHSYGSNNIIISLHAEVPQEGGFLEMHDLIDNIEKDIKNQYNCEVTIHMDPIATLDENINKLRNEVKQIVKQLDENLNIHDFRVVKGPTHSNIIFDVVVPHRYKMSDLSIKQHIFSKVRELDSTYNCVITVEKDYSS